MKEENKDTKIKHAVKSIAVLIITLYLIMSFIVSAYRIPTGSMERTLRVGDMLLVNKFIYGFRSPDWFGIPFTEFGFDIPYFKTPLFKSIKQGDVVVFKHFDEQMNQWLYYVKRCVALPGQTVEVVDKELFVDGKKFSEFYDTVEIDHGTEDLKAKARFVDMNIYPKGAVQNGIFKGLGNRDNFGPLTVPEGSYFMMGDNRDNSYDSRYWGFVTEDFIVGKPIMVYFSFDSEYPLTKLWKAIRWDRIGYFIQ
ncbi:MAG TPA: signal peptidase I [Clostridiales bacterium]|jgi:signal peptidase I|nr:signal peptidase I [Clostridiales bacterium]HQP69455.1 signal peptidase I [Clostridiales bacterium]